MRARARRARVTYMALGRVGVEFLPRVIPPSLGSIFCVFVIAGATSTKPLFSFSLPLRRLLSPSFAGLSSFSKTEAGVPHLLSLSR